MNPCCQVPDCTTPAPSPQSTLSPVPGVSTVAPNPNPYPSPKTSKYFIINKYIHKKKYTHTQTRKRHPHMCMHTYAHTCSHTHMHMHTLTHTSMPPLTQMRQSCYWEFVFFPDFCVYNSIPLRQGEVINDGCDKVCRCEDTMTNSIVCDER